MRQLVCDARNISHVIATTDDGEKKIVTNIEAVLTVQTRQREFLGPAIIQRDALETIRFEMSVEAAAVLREDIGKWIETAKEERLYLGVEADE